MTRFHWPRVMVYGGTSATALAAVIAACVNDGPTTVHCLTNLECAPNWLCTETGDACYPATCGDGIHDLRSGELCDDGNAVDGDGCSGHCLYLDHCGDGRVELGESCDDGNTVVGDGCSDRCQKETCPNFSIDPKEECDEGTETATCNDNCMFPRCGDRNLNTFFVNPLTNLPEVCDEGMNTATCDADCSLPECGDGLHNAANEEQCDDGINNALSGKCLPGCKLAFCGDGHVWQGVEECGEVPGVVPIDTSDCDADCTRPVCGDGYLNEAAEEECDDGNTSVNDACPSGAEGACELARCGDGFLHVGFEDCEPPAPNGLPMNSPDCDQDCTLPSCGDGIFNPHNGEQCDDGNRLDIDACRDSLEGGCQLARCGDLVVYLGVEECDDGDANREGACPLDCKLARCGDTFVQTGREECDHSGAETAACDWDCTFPVCGDGYRNRAAGEECDQNVPCDDVTKSCILTGLQNRCHCI